MYTIKKEKNGFAVSNGQTTAHLNSKEKAKKFVKLLKQQKHYVKKAI